ncbi:hypothetical protein F4821DRAFT_79622 [Hypoxylon rubiginosum]|uniref:Uncharacterized protein n=1 Tax=Hypoxylon rubiginosum TaxID=110542 RepID=A0ACC0DLV0_9PEZI|nr:hypothetical protein F4821DRAFT_79622 [Hypoxylon rubiginosum]
MLALSLLLLPLCGLSVSARGIHTRDSLLQYKRQTATCESTYGAGSEPCGGEDSGFCFSPSQGQTCCATDSGFCDAGRYCAPVAGFCCLEGEDLETCAKNAGFEVPLSASSASTPAAATATSMTSTMASTSASLAPLGSSEVVTVPGPTETVIPILKQSTMATMTQMQNVTCGFAAAATSMTTPPAAGSSMMSASPFPTMTIPTTPNVQSVPTAISNTNGTSPTHPLVEVSFAVRQTCTSAGLTRMVAVIAALIVLW